jgi:hypothetical protein
LNQTRSKFNSDYSDRLLALDNLAGATADRTRLFDQQVGAKQICRALATDVFRNETKQFVSKIAYSDNPK